MVGSTKRPRTPPPSTTLAPLAIASSICALTLAACLSLISGPMTLRLVLGRVADLELSGALDEALEEGLEDRVLHQHLLDRHADLALVHEAAEVGGLRRALHVGVVADDQAVLAAELDAGLLQVRAGAAAIMRPTGVLPVKLMPLMRGWSISSSPTSPRCRASRSAR
jgi:hypothetical protein